MTPMFNALVLSLPTRNSTLRMRVWRALKECGAAVLRDGVCLLPQAEAFDKLEKEIRAHGGFAMTFDATHACRGRPGRPARALRPHGRVCRAGRPHFRRESVAADARAPARLTALRRLEQALDKLSRIDFFAG